MAVGKHRAAPPEIERRPPFALKSGAPESPPNAEKKKTKKVRPPRPSIRRCGQQQQHRGSKSTFSSPRVLFAFAAAAALVSREEGGSLLFPTCNRRYLFQLAPTQNVTDMTSHGAGYRGKRGDENVLEPPSLRLKQSEVKTERRLHVRSLARSPAAISSPLSRSLPLRKVQKRQRRRQPFSRPFLSLPLPLFLFKEAGIHNSSGGFTVRLSRALKASRLPHECERARLRVCRVRLPPSPPASVLKRELELGFGS